MTQKEKQLLLKDLCARLPYGVKFAFTGDVIRVAKGIDLRVTDDGEWEYFVASKGASAVEITDAKPYLRPMSSMTEEERKEVREFGVCYDGAFHNDVYDVGTSMEEAFLAISWLIERHFDINYLINKGLALEAKEGMYKNE